MYLHPLVDPSLTHYMGEFTGLASVSDVVVPEGAHEAEISFSNFYLTGV